MTSKSTTDLDSKVRYPVISRRERLAAAWAGFQDGRKGLPAGEVGGERTPPACAAIHGTYLALLARVEAGYRRQEAGFSPVLMRSVHAMSATEGDPTVPGPAGRAARLHRSRTGADLAAGHDAADRLRAAHREAQADYAAVAAVAQQALSVYARHLLRWHPNREELSKRNWSPPRLPQDPERVSMRDDLRRLLDILDRDTNAPATRQEAIK